MSSAWEAEVEKFLALHGQEQWKWLADLLFALTVFARDTYTVGGDSLDNPQRMRRISELTHRTADQLRNHIRGIPGRPDEVFAKILTEEAEALGFDISSLRIYVK